MDINNINEKTFKNFYQIVDNSKLGFVEDLSEIDLKVKRDQRRFHFIPDFVIKEHYIDELFELNLYTHEIKRAKRNNFIVNLELDDWKNKYFQIIEACISHCRYEELLKESTTSSIKNSTLTILSDSSGLQRAIVYLNMRADQFTEESLLNGIVESNNTIIKTKYKDMPSMWIEYILKSLQWFNRKSDFSIFVKEFNNKLEGGDLDINGDFQFLIHNVIGDNWKDKYLNYYKRANKKDICMAISKPNAKLNFPMLDQPFGRWRLEMIPKSPFLRTIENNVYYLQFSDNRLFIYLCKEDLSYIFQTIENFIKEKNAPPLKNEAALLGSWLRFVLYFEDENLHSLYSKSKYDLEKFIKVTNYQKKKPLGNFILKGKLNIEKDIDVY